MSASERRWVVTGWAQRLVCPGAGLVVAGVVGAAGVFAVGGGASDQRWVVGACDQTRVCAAAGQLRVQARLSAKLAAKGWCMGMGMGNSPVGQGVLGRNVGLWPFGVQCGGRW